MGRRIRQTMAPWLPPALGPSHNRGRISPKVRPEEPVHRSRRQAKTVAATASRRTLRRLLMDW